MILVLKRNQEKIIIYLQFYEKLFFSFWPQFLRNIERCTQLFSTNVSTISSGLNMILFFKEIVSSKVFIER